ncbi:hypothetical protein ON010_g14713 [Phytophthora cinnamomi]|nr:hypothetical protein ON010_g14713 [Phytophthora cinnamomi]
MVAAVAVGLALIVAEGLGAGRDAAGLIPELAVELADPEDVDKPISRVRTGFRTTTSSVPEQIGEVVMLFVDTSTLNGAPNCSQVPHRGSGSAAHVWTFGRFVFSAAVSK